MHFLRDLIYPLPQISATASVASYRSVTGTLLHLKMNTFDPLLLPKIVGGILAQSEGILVGGILAPLLVLLTFQMAEIEATVVTGFSA